MPVIVIIGAVLPGVTIGAGPGIRCTPAVPSGKWTRQYQFCTRQTLPRLYVTLRRRIPSQPPRQRALSSLEWFWLRSPRVRRTQ